MKKLLACAVAATLLPVMLSARAPKKTAQWLAGQPLPAAVTDNAVAATDLGGAPRIFSMLGMDESKTPDGISQDAFSLDTAAGTWQRLKRVPGAQGRLASTAQAVGWRVFLLGGYTVSADGKETSLSNVDVLDVLSGSWGSAAPIPIPADDAVSGVMKQYVYLISGWSQIDNVNNVQAYDTERNVWVQATPVIGPPVFGHAGAIIANTIVYCDGVKVDPSQKPRFVMSNECYRGEISSTAPALIRWKKIAPHPGPPRYRMAAGVYPPRGLIVFAGGTTNPYNYNGVGYNGEPSEPESGVFAYDVARNRWITLPPLAEASMDHRGLVFAAGGMYLIGGMRSGQKVVPNVMRLEIP
ncbi:MAG: kelch repeat-containing protein [Acidobacteriota bacterium]